jgi:putative oxidoreductase
MKIQMLFNNESNKVRDIGLLILRIGLGAMFLFHGAPKLFGGPEMWSKIGGAAGNFGLTFLPAFWGFMAGVAEFGGGLAIMSGFLFIPGCILLIINLIVASSSHFHAGQGLGGASHAIEDGIVFLSLIFIGPGKYTFDCLLFSKKEVQSDNTN